MNKRPSTLLAGLALTATLVFSGCSIPTTDSAQAATASATTATVVEVSYADLDIDAADPSLETTDPVDVTLADGASEAGDGVSVDGDTVTIEAAGTYQVSGTLTSGSLIVDAPEAAVELLLDGVDITAADVAAINVTEADQVVLRLADGTTNTLADQAAAAVDQSVEDAPNATLFSTADLWIVGDGALSVTAHAADAITSKDTLVMDGGDLTLTAADDGLRGKDQLVLSGGTLTVDVDGDALRSDNESVTDDPEAALGVIWIDGTALDLTAGSDAVDATRQVTILSGETSIAAGDDAIHSDNVLRIAGGDITVTESVEGIEGAYVYLSGGDVSVVSSDDGINVAGGTESLTQTTTETTGRNNPPSGAAGGPPQGGAPPEEQSTATDPVDDPSSLTVSTMDGSGFGGPAEGDNGTRSLEISGGTYVIDTTSDGVDVNGSMTMTGGTLVVSGTEDARNGALDVDDTFTVTGGTLAANGTATMAVAPGDDSTQPTLALTFSGTMPADTTISIADNNGQQVASFTTPKSSNSLIYSSDDLQAGSEYTISVGAEAAGTGARWLTTGGTAEGGETIGTVAAT